MRIFYFFAVWLVTCNLYAEANIWQSPKSLLNSTNTWTASQVFRGTVTYSSNQRPVVASTPIATFYDVQQATTGLGGITAPSLQNPATGFFNTVYGIGVASSVAAAKYYVNSTSLILSTYAANFCDGCALYFSSGAIAANTSVTVSIAGVTTFLIPVCSELEGVNTAVVSVRLKSIAADRSSFIVYNADAINAKNFVCVVAGK